MNRRSFLSSMLALGAAPAIVRADSLMRIVPRETLVYEHVTYGRGYSITLDELYDERVAAQVRALAAAYRDTHSILMAGVYFYAFPEAR